jgi:hypothetical protein
MFRHKRKDSQAGKSMNQGCLELYFAAFLLKNTVCPLLSRSGKSEIQPGNSQGTSILLMKINGEVSGFCSFGLIFGRCFEDKPGPSSRKSYRSDEGMGFTTGDFFLIDDFEGRDADDNQIWYVWKGGLGYGAPGTADQYAGNGTGSAVGDETTASYTEETTVHGGDQSMPVSYNNNKQGYAGYSEVEYALTHQRGRTERGVTELSLWFRGCPVSTGSFIESPVGTFTMTGSGTDWTSMSWNPQNIPMNSNIYIGLVLTAHNAGATRQAKFSNVTAAMNVSGQWAD